MWRWFVKALKSTGTCHSFIQDKYVGESAGVRSGFPESALELSTGVLEKAAADGLGPQLFQPEMRQNNQTHVRYCYNVHDLEIAS